MNLNCQLQKDLLQNTESARIATDLLEKKLSLKIKGLEEKLYEYEEVSK